MLRETKFTFKDYSSIINHQKELIDLAVKKAIGEKQVDPKDIKSHVLKD